MSFFNKFIIFFLSLLLLGTCGTGVEKYSSPEKVVISKWAVILFNESTTNLTTKSKGFVQGVNLLEIDFVSYLQETSMDTTIIYLEAVYGNSKTSLQPSIFTELYFKADKLFGIGNHGSYWDFSNDDLCPILKEKKELILKHLRSKSNASVLSWYQENM
jgi:hypothetical protein